MKFNKDIFNLLIIVFILEKVEPSLDFFSFLPFFMGCSQAVRHRNLDPTFKGSNPFIPGNNSQVSLSHFFSLLAPKVDFWRRIWNQKLERNQSPFGTKKEELIIAKLD